MLPVLLLINFVAFICCVPVDKVEKELNQLSSVINKTHPARPTESITIESPVFISNWPSAMLLDKLGQVAGLSFCPKGYLYIFHRADRQLDEGSFSDKNIFLRIRDGPISENVILKINNLISEPKLVDKRGANLFYMPHGIFADDKYLWTTDIARHQMLRIPHGSAKPDLILGEKFIPGDDKEHFCKPTHVVAASTGEFFVADGYCNSRIVKFSRTGQFVTQFGNRDGPNKVLVPHHLVLIEGEDLLCTADRENFRVQCYCAGLKNQKDTGKLIRTIESSRFGPVYAVGYNKHNRLFYIVSGISKENSRSTVFIYDWTLDAVTGSFSYPGVYGFGWAHTIDVCPTGYCLAIGSLSKECSSDVYTCQELADESDDYEARNIWLYGLADEKYLLP